jgi:crotonobetainyl-CoA:carnitine CoA-transferase CaiB-like acyl-CoA transferase
MKKAPLSGIRIIEHGQLLAVPYAARMLADLGAEVVKVESPVRLDSHRQTTYPDNEPGERFWDRGGTFYSENRGKLGITLDLRHADAREAFRDLVRVSDVVMENFTTRVMQNFGLDYESLRQVKPDIIMFSSTGYGHTGPWANHRAVGPTTEAASGLTAITGYEDGPPVLPDIPYTDYIAAEQGVLAIMLALFRRRRTGLGCAIDLSQIEAQASLLGEWYLDAGANQAPAVPQGNRHPLMAPHGFFPCAGEDRWIAIAVSNDEEWSSLKKALGEPEWAAQATFATAEGRQKAASELEAALADWTRERDGFELMHLLQSHGVPAGVAYDARDLVFDEHLWERGFWEWADHPAGTGIDPKPYPGAPWRFSASERGISMRGPALGEHNQYVLSELLGYSQERIDEMASSGALGRSPADFPLPLPVPLENLVRQGRIREFDKDYLERLNQMRRATEPAEARARKA